jgi:N-ethylmaleimide reductase
MVTADSSAFHSEPGIFDQACIDGWKLTTDAVHKKGGRIYLQLVHGGRAAHSSNNNGVQPVAAFAVACSHTICAEWNGTGQKVNYEVPRAIKDDELPAIVDAFRQGARNAIEAGFDGIEVHAANGYLLDTFQRAPADAREGAYGGSIENRNRLTFEVLDAVIAEIGADRTGVRISPLNSYQDLVHEDPVAFTKYFAEKVNKLNIAYLHVLRGDLFQIQTGDVVTPAREAYTSGALILNAGFSIEEGEETLKAGTADAICYGTKFLANPDLVERVAAGAELNEMDASTFNTQGAKGYNDYPLLKA